MSPSCVSDKIAWRAIKRVAARYACSAGFCVELVADEVISGLWWRRERVSMRSNRSHNSREETQDENGQIWS